MNIGYQLAGHGDGRSIVALIRQLAVYQDMEEKCLIRSDDMEHLLAIGAFRGFVAFDSDSIAPRILGYALCKYVGTSSFTGRFDVELHDLYVSDQIRGQGAGSALLVFAASLCSTEGSRLLFEVLEWNEASIDFYVRHGAEPNGRPDRRHGQVWVPYVIQGEALERLQARLT